MDLRILEIASNTENNKILDKNYKVSVYSYDHYWYDLGTKSKLNKFKKMLK